MGLFNVDIGGLFDTAGDVIDELHTSKEELRQLDIEEKKIDADLMKGQMAVNAVEAKHDSIFVAGWRPAIGWIGAIAMGYQFIVYPMLIWIWTFAQSKEWIVSTLSPPPVLDSGALFSIITGMLGIAGMRSYDKMKGTNTKKMK